MSEVAWGPSGQVVYERTYSRVKPDGTKETWPETVERVARGNIALVYGDDVCAWSHEVQTEYLTLRRMMNDFRILPAGRHLWASGVKGRQYLQNCWTSGWGEKLSDHFSFTFLRLMEGGGVGANYSAHHLAKYGVARRELNVHIVCSPEHPDYDKMRNAGVLSEEYDAWWAGAFEVADSREGWAEALTDLIDTAMTDLEVKHKDRVYDVTNVRHEGARLKTFGGTASGPAPFARMMLEVAGVLNETTDAMHTGATINAVQAMEMDHAIAECVVSGGVRRSARMALVRWDDPHVFDFLACKQDTGKHWTTNISVEVDSRFFRALDGDLGTELYELAETVFERTLDGMLANGEPGFFNSELANEGELEPVYATNPCGEITLQEWEACTLGHVNLAAFDPKTEGDDIALAHELMARFLLRATFADINDPKSREIQDRNRRIGVGHLGVQTWLARAGVKWSEAPEHPWVSRQLRAWKHIARKAASDYAFALRIPAPVKVTTVAPTGSIAKLPGVPEGIHPIYGKFFERRIRFSYVDPDQQRTVDEAFVRGHKVEVDLYDRSGNTCIVVYPTADPLMETPWAEYVESADEISVDHMLRFQAMYQSCYADNAVSFTVNVSPETSREELAEALIDYLPDLKGTTIMVDESRPQAPYTRITQEEYEAAAVKLVEDSIDLECATGACPIR